MALKTAKLLNKDQLTHDVINLNFETKDEFQFEAGQFVTVKIDDQERPCFRAYSIASAPQGNGKFELCIKVVENGRGSNWLNTLEVGDTINFIGPTGKFVFQQNDKDKLFIATGTGVAPFRAMIEEQLNKGNSQKFQLLFGVRHIKDIFYQERLEKIAAEHQNFSFKLTLSRPENDSWQGITGRVTEHLSEVTTNTEVYICGLKDMIDAVTEILKSQGLPEENIHFEKYD